MFETDIPKAQHEAEVCAARADAAAAERARINAILTSDAASERPRIAKSLALNTDMSAEAAEAFMADLPPESRSLFAVQRGGLRD